MRNLRHLIRRSGLLSNDQRRRRSEKSRRSDVTQRRLGSEMLEKRELLAGDLLSLAPHHNYWNAYDVNDDGQISSRDALAVINQLSRSGEGELTAGIDNSMFYDVNADNNISASDALGVINAMSRGEEVGELVELLLTARDLNDNRIVADSNGVINVNVGQVFDLEVAYDDLRQFNNRLGVFQLFTDIAVSQPGVLSPVLNETQRLIIDSSIMSVSSDSLTFTIDSLPPGAPAGSSTTFVSPINDFGSNSRAEVVKALTEFGFSPSQYELSEPDFGNGDIGFQIHFVGSEFGNVNLPNIDVEVNETNPADDIPTQSIEFAPFLADGVTPNSDAVRFNINSFSRTFNDNEQFYAAQNRGTFDASTGFTGVGGLGQVPLTGGGIPQLTDDGSFIEPFDAFSIRVFLNQPVTNLVIGVNPGEDPESTLLYGRDDAVPQDLVLIDTTTNTNNNGDTQTNGTAQLVFSTTGTNPQPGTLAIAPASLSVNETAGTATFTVNRTGGSDGAVTVAFTTANGTATAGSDYTANSGTLNFADGETSKTITVAIIDDTVEEGAETFTVTLSSPTGGAVLGATTVSTATIAANDSTTPVPGVLSISPATLSVGESAGTATFTVTRAGGSDGAVAVNFTTANGTATAGSDYTANSGTLNFADGETSKTITVAITDDTVAESNETFTVTLSSPTGGASLGTTVTSTATITDNDTNPLPGVLSISPATLSVGEAGGTATFTVNRTGGSEGAVAVNFATANGTATAGTDYTANSGTLNFANGETSKTITVAITNDTLDENNETFTVTLTNPTGGATLGTTTVSTATIVDDESPVPVPGVLTISPATLSVGEAGGTATFTVNRSGGSDGAVTVNFATANGTATAGSDYTANSGTLNFANGETSKTITVAITNDTVAENNETFTVTLTNPTGGATLGATAVSTATIVDNDTVTPIPGVLSISPASVSVNESAGTVSLTITRASGSDGAVSVSFATSNGTATAGSDYTANSGTVNFANGETSKTVTIAILEDAIDEVNETFTVTLSSPTGGATLGTTTSSTISILDNDPSGPGTATVSGSIFIDHVENLAAIISTGASPIRNGVQDSDERGLGSIPVRLIATSNQNPTVTTITALDGSYNFQGVAAGTYRLVFDVPADTVLFVGTTERQITVASDGSVSGVTSFPVVGTTGSALENMDILASSFLRSNPSAATVSSQGREGGVVSLDAGGDQNLFLAGEGFDNVVFGELVLNDDRDAALLTVIQTTSNGLETLTARLSADQFVVSKNGRGVQFFGSFNDFDFVPAGTDGLDAEFDNYRDAIDEFMSNMG